MKSKQFALQKRKKEKVEDGDDGLPADVEPNILEVSPLVAHIMSKWRHDPKALVALFHSCHENWKKYTNFHKRKKWSDEVYAVYKQATQGNNRAEIPYEEEARKKWHAWKRLHGMTKGEAQRRYITLLAQIDEWLVVPKDPEESPPGFVRTKGDEIICARSNAKRMCTQPLLEVFDPKQPPTQIAVKLDEDESLLEGDNFREYMSKVMEMEGHRCQYGVHRPITLLEAKPFLEWFSLPLVEGFSPYKNQPVIAIIKQFLQRQYNILEYMQAQEASYFVQVRQLKLVSKVNDFYKEVSGEEYVHEANCIRDNDHCNRRRQIEGGFNHTHVVLLEWPQVDYSAYSKVVELRLECGRRGLSMITGVVTDPDKRAKIYIDRLEEYYRIEAKKALARERQRFRALRRPVNIRNMKHQQADQAESALAKFLMDGDTSKVLRNIEYGTDPDLEVRGGLTPLILGALSNTPEFITVLVTHGASVNYENAHGMTALMWACKADNPEMVKLLLNLGADAFQESETGMTAMMVLARHGHVRIFDILINFVRERTVLQYREDHVEGGKADQEKAKAEAQEAELEKVRQQRLAKLDAADAEDSDSDSSQIQVREKERQTLLAQSKAGSKKNSTASQKRKTEAAGEEDTEDGIDPAIKAGEEAVSKLLNHQNKHGLTALMLCCRHRCKESLLHLLKKGADPKMKVGDYDAEAIAVAGGYNDLVEILKMNQFTNWSGSLERRVAKGQYFAAIAEGNIVPSSIAESKSGNKFKDSPSALELISDGLVMPDQESDGGLNALIVAAKNGDHQGVFALLKQGADPNYANRNGFTAVMAAAQAGHIPIIGELLQAGGDPNVEDLDGKSCITHAAGHAVVGRALIAASTHGNEAGVLVIAEALRIQAELQDGEVHHDGQALLQWLGLHPPDPEFELEFDSWKWRLAPEKGGLGYAPNKPPTPEPPPPLDPHPARCFKCTLVPPCKHFETMEELLEQEPEKARKWRWGERFKPDPPKKIGPLVPPSIEKTHELNWRMLQRAKIWRETDMAQLSRRMRMKRTNQIYATIDAALLARKLPKGTLPSLQRPKTPQFNPSLAKTWSPGALQEEMHSPAISALGKKISKRPRSAQRGVAEPLAALDKLSPRPLSASSATLMNKRALRDAAIVDDPDPKEEMSDDERQPLPEGEVIEQTRQENPIKEPMTDKRIVNIPKYIADKYKRKDPDKEIQDVLDYGLIFDEKRTGKQTTIQFRTSSKIEEDPPLLAVEQQAEVDDAVGNEEDEEDAKASEEIKKENASDIFEQRLKKLEYERMQDFYRDARASKRDFKEEKKVQQALAREYKAMSLEDERSTAIELEIRAEKKYLEDRREARVKAEQGKLENIPIEDFEKADAQIIPEALPKSEIQIEEGLVAAEKKNIGDATSPVAKDLVLQSDHDPNPDLAGLTIQVPPSEVESAEQGAGEYAQWEQESAFANAAQLVQQAEASYNEAGGWDESYNSNYYGENQPLITSESVNQVEEYDYYAEYQEPVEDPHDQLTWDEYGYYGNSDYNGDQDNEAVLSHWYGETEENAEQQVEMVPKSTYGNFVCGRCKKTFGRRLGTLKTARLCNECLANRKQAPAKKMGALHKKMRAKNKGYKEDDAVKRFNDLLEELDSKKDKRKSSMSKMATALSSELGDMHTLLLAGRKKAQTNTKDIQPDGFEIWRHRLDEYEERKVFEDHMTNEQLAAREAEKTGLEIYTKPAELDLAEWMLAQGQVKKVRPLIESALRAQREALGADHVQVALTLRVRAKLQTAKGKLNAARATLEESYEMLTQKLGPTHKECIKSSHLIADMYIKQEEYDQARLLYEMLSKEHQGSVQPEIQALCQHYSDKSREVTEIEEATEMKKEDDLAFAIEDRLRRPEVYEYALQGKQVGFLERLLQKKGPGAKLSFKRFKKFSKEYGAEHLFGFYTNVYEFSLMKPKQEGFAKKARFIYKEFIKPQYKLPMLTKLIRAELTDCMEEAIRPLTPDLFDAAQKLCLEAIFRGPYMQFMDTDDGKYFAERQQDR